MLSVLQNSTSIAKHPAMIARAISDGRLPVASVLEEYSCQYRNFPAGAEIYSEGETSDEFFVVIEGWVFQHQILEDGRRQILDFALPGTLLGFQPERGAEMTHAAEALTAATLAVIPRNRLGEFLARDPEFGLRMISAAAGALNTAYESLTDVGRRTAREAVAHLLLRLFVRICALNPHVAGTPVDFPLTQEHIGDALGLTAVHVCRTLRGLRQDGVVQLNNGRLNVPDIDSLIEIAGCTTELGAFPEALVAPRAGMRQVG
jgi:CRP-like cAMP-binding protein